MAEAKESLFDRWVDGDLPVVLTEDEKIWLVGLLTGVRPALTRDEVAFLTEVLPDKREAIGDRENNWLHLSKIHSDALSELREGLCKFEAVDEVLAEIQAKREERAEYGDPDMAFEKESDELEQVIRFLLVRDRWKSAPADLRYAVRPDGVSEFNIVEKIWESLPEVRREKLTRGMAEQGDYIRRRWRAGRVKQQFLGFYHDGCYMHDIALERIVRELELPHDDTAQSYSSNNCYGMGDCYENDLRTRRLTIEEILEAALGNDWQPWSEEEMPCALRFASPEWRDLFSVMRDGDELWFCNDGGWAEIALVRGKTRINSVFLAHYLM